MQVHNSDTYTHASFSFKNRCMRLAWGLAYCCLFRPSPRPFHSWRAFLLKIFGANVGRGAHVYPKAVIWAPWNLTLGDECGIADGAILYSQGQISIGRRAVISQGSHLCAGTHDYESEGMPLIAKPIAVGNFAWITAECFVHAGVTVGEGAVIGARSVVTKNIPPWMVCAGNPCKPLKPRIMKAN